MAVRKLYQQHGESLEDIPSAPVANKRNLLAWTCWHLIWPDCREYGMAGGLFLDWEKVDTVLDIYGVPLTPTLHRKLRQCVFEILAIEDEERKAKKEIENGKRKSPD